MTANLFRAILAPMDRTRQPLPTYAEALPIIAAFITLCVAYLAAPSCPKLVSAPMRAFLRGVIAWQKWNLSAKGKVVYNLLQVETTAATTTASAPSKPARTAAKRRTATAGA